MRATDKVLAEETQTTSIFETQRFAAQADAVSMVLEDPAYLRSQVTEALREARISETEEADDRADVLTDAYRNATELRELLAG